MKILRKNSERDKIRIKSLEEIEGKLQEQLKAANETISAKDEQHKKCGDCKTLMIIIFYSYFYYDYYFMVN